MAPQYQYDPVGTADQLSHSMETGQLWRQYVIAAVANIAVTCAGFSMGWTSPVNAKLDSVDQSPLPDVPTPHQGAWVGSFLSIGAIFGPFVGGFTASKIGRKWGLLSSAIPLFTGWALVAAASSVGFLYGGRVCWGIAVGMIFTLTPMYCAEISTDDCRGALGSFLQSFLSIGLMLVYSVGPLVSYWGLAYVGTAVVAAFCLSFFFMPESPIYYLTKNNREAAAKSLMKIRGQSHIGVQAELDKMEVDVQASSKGKTATDFFMFNKILACKFTPVFYDNKKVAHIFRGSNFKAFYISCGLVFFQQFSGINAVLFYMTDIFQASGASVDSAVATIIVGAVQVVASLITPFVVDRVGRRILLLVSSFGTAVGLGLLGTYFLLSAHNHPLTDSISWLPVCSLMLFIVSFCWGLGSLPWAMLSELFPIEIKAIATPIATAFAWTLSFLTTRYFSAVADAVGMHVAFWIFGVSCTVCFFFTLFFVPETKGKSFSEIQDMLAGRKAKLNSQI